MSLQLMDGLPFYPGSFGERIIITKTDVDPRERSCLHGQLTGQSHIRLRDTEE